MGNIKGTGYMGKMKGRRNMEGMVNREGMGK